MIATSIKDMRKRLGWSQAKLAAEIGVTQANVGHYESERHEPSPPVARRIVSVGNKNGVQISFDTIYGHLRGQKEVA
ncbi:MAG: helix-turn-helix transcriptional regulator [Burkholderiales bacterium]|jgi:putative transcriptional regulator|nr:helix-turn-helix transcriptional regulator [Burkholderiales bacterium]